MSFRRILLQPVIRISAPTTQEVRYAAPTSGWMTALVWANVFENATAVKATVDLRGGSNTSMSDDTSGTPSFWPSLGTFQIDVGVTGAFKSSAIQGLPAWLRWQIPSLAAPLTLELVLELWDE